MASLMTISRVAAAGVAGACSLWTAGSAAQNRVVCSCYASKLKKSSLLTASSSFAISFSRRQHSLATPPSRGETLSSTSISSTDLKTRRPDDRQSQSPKTCAVVPSTSIVSADLKKGKPDYGNQSPKLSDSESSTSTSTSMGLIEKPNAHRDEVKKKQFQSPKLLHKVFAELMELPTIQEMVGGVRVRQHVNPLKAALVAPLAPVNWDSVFTDSTLPLMVDIGCGSGRLLMVLAKRSAGTKNFLGLDIRELLVDRAVLWAEELNLSGNVYFITANATLAFHSLLATYPGPLAYVSILCPDPHFKRKHKKRRIVQKKLVDAIVHYLKPGGEILVQSDVKDVALEMRAEFDEQLGKALQKVARASDGEDRDDDAALVNRDSEGWISGNPLGVPSEREAHVEAKGGRVYRALYTRL